VEFPGAGQMPAKELLCVPCDVLMPAAIGGVITEANAKDLNCKFVVEAANGPTTPEVGAGRRGGRGRAGGGGGCFASIARAARGRPLPPSPHATDARAPVARTPLPVLQPSPDASPDPIHLAPAPAPAPAPTPTPAPIPIPIPSRATPSCGTAASPSCLTSTQTRAA
jgi:hypothetical protein